MYDYETIKFELKDNGIGILTLNRPDNLNAISFQMIEDLHELLDHLMINLDCRVLILQGAGKSFCVGLDLIQASILVSRKKPENLRKFYYMDKLELIKSKMYFLLRISHLTIKLRKISQPIIAIIQGNASGGGFALSMAADIRIASEDALFNNAFIKIGVTGTDIGSSYFLPRLINTSRATEIMYTGRFVDAKEAEKIGYVSAVVKKEEIFNEAMSLAKKMLKTSPLGLRMTKQAMNLTLDTPSLETLIQLENRAQAVCMTSKDLVEGSLAWYDKRDPKYSLR